jgi:uncharacterized protein (UPF0332 family)
VKPETALFLAKARELLDQADTMMGVGLNEPAGRTAYLAGFHAAQGLIFETTGRVFKRHPTVQREFGRLTKGEPRVDDKLRAFLPRTYNLKRIADYETGPGSHVSAESALRYYDRPPIRRLRHGPYPAERSCTARVKYAEAVSRPPAVIPLARAISSTGATTNPNTSLLRRRRGVRPAAEPAHGGAAAGQDPRSRRHDAARRQQPGALSASTT